ncbi:MAG: PAS domain S-box protein, partial [Calditrichota bacterium]
MKVRKIQTRFAILMATICVVFLIGYTAIHYFDLQKRRATYRSEELETRVMLDNMIELLSKSQSLFTYDYTFWDDMVKFANAPDSEWAAINIDNAMITFQVQNVWVLTQDLKLIYHASRNSYSHPPHPIIDQINLERLFRTEAFNHFYLYTPSGMMNIYTAPIQPSADTLRVTEAQGYFLTGRLLDEAYSSELARLIDSDIVISDEMPMPAGPKVYNRSAVSVVKNLFSWDGSPVGSISAVRLMPLFREMELYTAREYSLYLLFALVIVGLIIYYLMKWVGMPLQKLFLSLRDDDPVPAAELQANPTEFGLLAHQVVQAFRQKDELREKTKTLQTLISASPEAIVVFDADANITLWNEAAERIFGWRAVETLGRPNPTVKPEFGPEGYQRFCGVMKGESFSGFETKRCRKDGTMIDVSVASAPLREENGRVVGVLCMYADIT